LGRYKLKPRYGENLVPLEYGHRRPRENDFAAEVRIGCSNGMASPLTIVSGGGGRSVTQGALRFERERRRDGNNGSACLVHL